MERHALTLRRHRLALAGLLHDIGKLAQRAGKEFRATWSDAATRREFRYVHALLTENVVRELIPAQELKVGDDFALLAGYHHAPKTAEQALIRLADQLSAGERASGDAARDDSDRGQHPRLLHPIFARVSLEEGSHPRAGQRDAFFVPLGELRLTREALFPQDEALSEDEVWARYEALWKTFVQGAGELRAAVQAGRLTLPAYLEAMQALMMRTTWAVPAAYWRQSYADISLYDHSRMTAALAAALADFDPATIERLTQAWHRQDGPGWDEPVALLVGGDISGVQKFIYTISSRGAAKALRGRSFYLQLLTEAVLRFVLRELGLPYTSVIYSGGGHFFVLAPRSVEAQLPEVRRRITQKLLTHHGVALYLVVEGAQVPLQGFAPGRFPAYWDAMHRRMQEAKAHRYAELGEEMYDWVFAVPRDGGGDKHCVVCGADDVTLTPWKEEPDSYICPQCLSYVDGLGKRLPQSQVVHWHWIEPRDEPRHDFAAVLRAFGAEVSLRKESELGAQVRPGDTLWLMDDVAPETSLPATPVWTRYVVHQIPHEGDRPLTFEELEQRCRSGFQRLGVLRMDVDNLGEVFKRGLGSAATLSRLAALGFQMSLFFEGWVKRIIAREGRDQLIYAVYAGGDDLFLIGPWDIMPQVALDIAQEFRQYTGGHPALHLSGGLAFIHGKYPVYQAAADAGVAEQQAKQRPGKNAFTFLGLAWSWPEFEALAQKKDVLQHLVTQARNGGGKVPKSLLMLLSTLARMEREAADCRGRPVWGRWMWMAAYHLARAMERHEAAKAELAQIRQDLEVSGYRTMPQWGAAARWAQLLTRKSRR